MKLTPRERLEKCVKDESVRAPTGPQVAKILEAEGRWHVTCSKCTTNTDRQKPAGLRYRIHEGLGREGYVIEVWRKGRIHQSGHRLLSHETSEGYRTNRELAKKALDLLNSE